MAEFSTSLIVRGESAQSLYTQFRSGRLVVNRRYQRKLVWVEAEKQAFIDSLLKDMPVPLILVAEVVEDGVERLEVIDGLQRLNAVFGFFENEFGMPHGYFDLNALAETKQLMDEGELEQREPAIGRSQAVELAGYTLPISVYRTGSNDKIDEVFRRINSNGRHLSRQEIRQAGCLSTYADSVRTISAAIRGDFSVSDMVDLKRMPHISISSTANGPGVFVDDIFWVKHRVLDREQVRTSRDEEIIADLLVTMLADPTPPYDSKVLDEFYGLVPGTDSRPEKIDAAIVKYSPEEIQARFDDTLVAFNEIFNAEHYFHSHFFPLQSSGSPVLRGRVLGDRYRASHRRPQRHGLRCCSDRAEGLRHQPPRYPRWRRPVDCRLEEGEHRRGRRVVEEARGCKDDFNRAVPDEERACG